MRKEGLASLKTPPSFNSGDGGDGDSSSSNSSSCSTGTEFEALIRYTVNGCSSSKKLRHESTDACMRDIDLVGMLQEQQQQQCCPEIFQDAFKHFQLKAGLQPPSGML